MHSRLLTLVASALLVSPAAPGSAQEADGDSEDADDRDTILERIRQNNEASDGQVVDALNGEPSEGIGSAPSCLFLNQLDVSDLEMHDEVRTRLKADDGPKACKSKVDAETACGGHIDIDFEVSSEGDVEVDSVQRKGVSEPVADCLTRHIDDKTFEAGTNFSVSSTFGIHSESSDECACKPASESVSHDITSTDGAGELEGSDVDTVLRRHYRPLVRCAEKLQRDEEFSEGKIALRFIIRRDWRVTHSEITKDTIGSGMGKCTSEVIQNARFPRLSVDSGPSMTVEVTFHFEEP